MAPAQWIIIISAPSGAGKTTLVEAILRELPQMERCVTTTTREKRDIEVPGRDYRFVTRKEFEAMAKRGEFFEYSEVHGNLYGNHRDQVQDIISRKHHCLLIIDVQGAKKIRALYPKTKTIFIEPPSLGEMIQRIEKRGGENPEDLKRRLESAAREMKEKDAYDFVLVNDDLERAKVELLTILREIVEPSERRRSHR